MNNTTQRHPRTLQEAFGPYASHEVHDPEPQHALTPIERGLIAVIYSVSVCLVIALAVHVWARFS